MVMGEKRWGVCGATLSFFGPTFRVCFFIACGVVAPKCGPGFSEAFSATSSIYIIGNIS